MKLLNRKALPRRRGVAIVMTAATLVTLLLCATLAVDLGHIHAVAAEMQNTADGAALAGAGVLKEGYPESALDVALDIIARNQKPQGFLSLDDQVIEFGIWHSVDQTFTPLADSTSSKAFAARVVSYRTDTPYFFAALIGKYSADVAREAVAIGSGPCTGIWGLQGIRAGSINTDSYNSKDAAYSELTAGDDGDLCSGRYIDMNGSFDVRGDVMAGFGWDVTIAGGSGDITGLTTSDASALAIPPIEVPITNDNDLIGLTNLGKSPWKGYGNLDIQGQNNLTLAPGTYVFDSVKLAGGSSITVTGPTTIYILTEMDATGGTIINETKDPHNLTILSPSTTYLKLGGGSAFYGSILAPEALVEIKGNDNGYFGALVARIVEMKGDATVHLDESLPLNGVLFKPPNPFLVR